MGCKNREYFLKFKIYLLLFHIPFMFTAQVIKPLEFCIPVKQIPKGDMEFFPWLLQIGHTSCLR